LGPVGQLAPSVKLPARLDLEVGTPLAGGQEGPRLARPPERDPLGSGARDETGTHCAELLDPLELALATPPGLAPAAADSPAAGELSAAVEALVHRICWGGDRRMGSARIELCGGAFAGGCLTVHADGRRVTLELELPPGTDAERLERRITDRLRARGLDVGAITVRER
jgi:hypothetical protein